jgi:predicted TIM-barrel fold metal-dependent hydrolase
MAVLDTIPFVDAHAHFWQLDRLDYAWLTPPFDDSGPNGDVSAIAHDYGPADYSEEAARWNVVGAVHVEAGAAPSQAIAETDWVQSVFEAHPLATAIVAFAALDAPDIDAQLAAQAKRQSVRGVRQIVNWHLDPNHTYTPRDVTSDDRWQRGFARLADHSLSFDLQAYPGQFSALARLIERHPDIPVFLNHAGMGVDGEADWLNGLRALARLPHVAIKLSGLGFAVRPWDTQAAGDRVRRAIDLFGTDRAMMASNFPTDRLFASFDETLAMLHDTVADLSGSERSALFAANANRLYRLGLDLAPAPDGDVR